MGEIFLLRHFPTFGNTEGRYIGNRTDESLWEPALPNIRPGDYPAVDRIYASPMRRCLETAERVWGAHREIIHVEPDLRECDFGKFENRNYAELNGDPDYQAWLDSGGTLPFPGGEDLETFKARCQSAFARIADQVRPETRRIALVVHGGTIMAALERFGTPAQSYFDYQVKNGQGYLLTPVEGTDLWNYRSWP